MATYNSGFEAAQRLRDYTAAQKAMIMSSFSSRSFATIESRRILLIIRNRRTITYIATAAMVIGILGVGILNKEFIKNEVKLIPVENATWPAMQNLRERNQKSILWFLNNLLGGWYTEKNR
jgi:hypothetical protein